MASVIVPAELRDLTVRAFNAPWARAIEVLVHARQGRDNPELAEAVDLVWQPAPQLGERTEPTFRLPYANAQMLMDDLWACGIRPTEGAGSAGALAATQAHLKDLQRLVFERPVASISLGGT